MDNKLLGVLALVFGILLLIGSVITFLVASIVSIEYNTLEGELERALNEDAQRQYEAFVVLGMCSIIGFLIGLILTVVGGYLCLKQPQQQQSYQPPMQQYQQPYQPPQQEQPPPQQPY